MMNKILIYILLVFLPISEHYAQNSDIDWLKNINLNRNKNFDNFFIGVTNSATPISIGLPVAMLGIGYFSKDKDLQNNSYFVGASLISSLAITTILKYSVNRDRPYITYPILNNLAVENTPSFPSGHTTEAFAIATSISLSYPKWYVIAPSFVWASLVGYSRMDLGVHYPSDVIVGALIGVGSSFLCYQIQKHYFK